MLKTLVIGFGNLYRRDDGVAFRVINALREQLGRPHLDWEEDGFDDLEHQVDTVLLHQLVPEIAEIIARYEQIIFVDAHVSQIEEPVRIEPIEVCYKESTVPHQLHPCSVLAIANEFYGCTAQGLLVSIRGHDFDFGDELSAQTAALVPQATAHLMSRLTPASRPKDNTL